MLRTDRDRTPIRDALGRRRCDDVDRELDLLVRLGRREWERQRAVLELGGVDRRSEPGTLLEPGDHRVDHESGRAAAAVDMDHVILAYTVVLQDQPEPHALAVLHAHADGLL